MGLSLDETQNLLKCAGYAPLYARLPFDCIVIYAIVIMFSRYASVSAMAAGLLFPIINYYFGFSFFSFGGEEASVVLLVNNVLRVAAPMLMAAILCVSYAESIKNLLSGTEKKI